MTDLTNLTAAELDALPAAIEAEKARRAEPDYEAWRPALKAYCRAVGAVQPADPFNDRDKILLQGFIAARPLMPPEDGGWIAWHGGVCPVAAGTLTEVKFRDGKIGPRNYPEMLCWSDAGRIIDIIAYRVVKS